MRIPDSIVEKLLKASKKITDEQLKVLHLQEVAEKKQLQELVVRNSLISEHDLTKMYAEEIDVPFVELNPAQIKREVLTLIPERLARQYRVVLFAVGEDNAKLVALEDPDDVQAINFLQKQLGGQLKIHVATANNIQAA